MRSSVHPSARGSLQAEASPSASTEGTVVDSPAFSPRPSSTEPHQTHNASGTRHNQRDTRRRAHTKSRLGCRTCRRRRVKCDESRPSCGNCVKHAVVCDFVTSAAAANAAASSSISSVPQAPGGINMADLELMHNFTTLTFATLASEPAVRNLFRNTAVRMAVDCEYIMRSILALSALHIARYRSQQRDLWLDRAMQHHQVARDAAIGHMGPLDPDEAERLHIFSVMTVYYALGCPVNRVDSDTAGSLIPHWLHLVHHAEPLINLLDTKRYHGKLSPLLDFGRQRMQPFVGEMPAIDPKLLKGMQVLVHRHCGETELLPIYDNMIEQLRRILGLLLPASSRRGGVEGYNDCDGREMDIDDAIQGDVSRRPEGLVEINDGSGNFIEPSKCWASWTHPDACDILVWQWALGKDFLPLLERTPAPPQEALVIWVHCLLVMRKLETQWWLEGWAEHLMGKTWEMLDEEHRSWVSWAVREMGWIPPA